MLNKIGMTLEKFKSIVEKSGVHFTLQMIEKKYEVGMEIVNVDEYAINMLYHHSRVYPNRDNVLEFQITVMWVAIEKSSIVSLKVEILQGLSNISGEHSNFSRSGDVFDEYSDYDMIDAQGNHMETRGLWRDRITIRKLYSHSDETCYLNVDDVYSWLYKARGVGTYSMLNVSNTSIFLNVWTWPLPMLGKEFKNYVSFYYFYGRLMNPRLFVLKGTNDPLGQLLGMAHVYLYLKKYKEKQKGSVHDIWNKYDEVIIFLKKHVPVDKNYVCGLKDHVSELKKYVEEYPKVLFYIENQYR